MEPAVSVALGEAVRVVVQKLAQGKKPTTEDISLLYLGTAVEELRAMRGELDGTAKTLRTELNEAIHILRTEMNSNMNALRTEVAQLNGRMDEDRRGRQRVEERGEGRRQRA